MAGIVQKLFNIGDKLIRNNCVEPLYHSDVGVVTYVSVHTPSIVVMHPGGLEEWYINPHNIWKKEVLNEDKLFL